jgi:ABC-type nitrate/sulfonate/bicarbonate transport system ATPase subunit
MNAFTKAERLLTINKLNLSYGPKHILRDVTVEVDNITRPGLQQGQVVALLGPSGIGKTQLFRCIAGLQPFQSGELHMMGKPVQAGEIGVVQQAYPLMQHRSVWSNLMLAAHGIKERIAEAEKLLAHFGLTDKKGSYPLELSGGQRQRVAIVQQLVCSSHFLLMDEPFSGLDVVAKDRVMDTIRTVTSVHEHNTVIFTTHDIESAVALADDIWVMGREEGKPGGTIVKRYNLATMGLAWSENITRHPLFWPTVLEIRELFPKL